jgi:predicted DNA-binding WGR domain protein
MQTLERPILENITLYYREGTSDKVYQCAIEPAGERFVVNFAYGRRGSTLNTGTKTNVPVDYEDALRIFNKLMKEKQGNGYMPGQSGTPYQTPETAERFTGILPQLLIRCWRCWPKRPSFCTADCAAATPGLPKERWPFFRKLWRCCPPGGNSGVCGLTAGSSRTPC